MCWQAPVPPPRPPGPGPSGVNSRTLEIPTAYNDKVSLCNISYLLVSTYINLDVWVLISLFCLRLMCKVLKYTTSSVSKDTLRTFEAHMVVKHYDHKNGDSSDQTKISVLEMRFYSYSLAPKWVLSLFYTNSFCFMIVFHCGNEKIIVICGKSVIDLGKDTLNTSCTLSFSCSCFFKSRNSS